ncbi:PKD domain-containing protein [Modestobacter sp. NPDC049651]|uniref:PKD domain-containing protein n=1 Tax=unclassified Modestobacter TaxID=2643866 RepID=UPI0033FFFC88
MSRTARWQARTAAVTAALTVTGALAVLAPGAASADSAPLSPSPANPVTASVDALPTVQIDGVAWAQTVVGNTVYVGGSFTSARPAGAPAGTGETPRRNLLAYDIRTGELVSSFAPDLNGQVLAVTASPDGRRVYVAGDFTTADGQTRKRVAAYDTATGALVANWKPNVNSQVRALAVTDDTVYMGGSITAVGGVTRTRLAAVKTSDGSLLPWAPLPGVGSTAGNSNGNKATSDQVMALAVTGGGNQVVAAGRFDTMNGTRNTGVSALDPVTGEVRPFAINQQLTNQGVNSAIYSLSTQGDTVFGTAYDYYGPGNLEGTFAVKADGGTVLAINDCRGDTYSSFPADGVLYLASHEHDCANAGGFPEQKVRVNKFANAFTTAATGTVGNATLKNKTFAGKPAPSQLNWWPSMKAGTFTGQGQAGWSVSGNSTYVVYGGEFTQVNGEGQQGLVRFAVPSAAPNKVGPTYSDGLTPTVTAAGPGAAKVTWTATSDQDNENLTYRVVRDGDTSTPVQTVVQASRWYSTPQMSFVDTGLTGGTHTYKVTATDPFGNSTTAKSATVTVAEAPAGGGSSYPQSVVADGATDQWRLGDTSGATTADSIGAQPLTVGTGVTRGVEGALAGDKDTAASFNGSSSASLSTQTAAPAPNTFTAEAWFQTSSKTGARLFGFGNAKTGNSRTADRQVYLDAAGHVAFGVNVPVLVIFTQKRAVTSSATFNDGKWHHVAATMSPAGMALYVDGKLVGSRTDTTAGQAYSGYLRVGADTGMGTSSTLTGRIDEVAVYPTALSADQIARHFTLGTTGTPANAAPTARFGQTASFLAVGFDASKSVDLDGTVAGYAWDFGDGTTGTGVAPAHSYREAGTYQVKLTVTDDKGATGTTTVPVTVVANRAPVAVFTPTATLRTVAVDASASGDSDGKVASWAWDFGDGTTGTGVTANHTYDEDGTYTVALTVTDDAGATSTVRSDVSVWAPVSVATDAFDRTVANGLGTADLGGAWTMSNGTTRQSVTPGAANLRLDAAGNLTASYLGGVSQTSADLRTTVALSAVPTGGGTSVYVVGRRVGSNQEYRTRLRFLVNGTVGLTMTKLTGTSTEAFIGSEVIVPGLTYTPGTALKLRVQVSGTGTTQLAATVWADGQAEPASPTLTRTDTEALLQTPGGIGLAAYLSGSATAPAVVSFGPLAVTNVR